MNETDQPLVYQPPLAVWLNGAVVSFVGSSHPLTRSLVSLMATGMAIWLTTAFASRIGGTNMALIAAVLMCSHPWVLESAIVPTNSAMGMSLLLAAVFGFQRHLERSASSISPSLLMGGVTWGLSLLAIGPIAFVLPLVFALDGLPFASHSNPEVNSSRALSNDNWYALKSALIFTAIGLVIGGWWNVMMVWQYGTAFSRSWWTSLPVGCLSQGDFEGSSDRCPVLQQSLREGFLQMSMIAVWVVIGVERAWQESHSHNDDATRRRYRLLMMWWWIALAGRMIAAIVGTLTVANTFVWNVALVVPTLLMAALGIGSLIERTVSQRGEFLLVVALISLFVYSVTGSSLAGIACGLATIVCLIYGPQVLSSTSGRERRWTESNWRRLLRFVVCGSLAANLWVGLGARSGLSLDEHRLADLKTRLATLPDVRRISLVSSREPIPVALRYVLQCRWPRAEIVTSVGWDEGLTEAMDAEGLSPHSRFLVLEGTRHDIRVSVNAGHAWQVSAVGNPMQFHGRRISMALIGPRD